MGKKIVVVNAAPRKGCLDSGAKKELRRIYECIFAMISGKLKSMK